jgi:hypothetical protein
VAFPTTPNPGFTRDELEREKSRLVNEYKQVADVHLLITQLKFLFGFQQTPAQVDLKDIANRIKDQLPGDHGTQQAAVPGLGLVGEIIDAASTLPFETIEAIEPQLGLIAMVFSLAAELAQEPDGSRALSASEVFQTSADQLGVELSNRFRATSEALDRIGEILVTDAGKLDAADAKIRSGAWKKLDNLNVLDVGVKQFIWQTLLPAAYQINVLNIPASGHRFQNTECLTATSRVHPFTGAADSSAYAAATGVDDNGQATSNGLSVLAHGFYDPGPMTTMPASISDPLFTPAWQGGVGLSQPWLLAHGGFAVHDQRKHNCPWPA